MKNSYNLPKSALYEDNLRAATMGRNTVGYRMGFYNFIFNVSDSPAMEHMIIVDKWS